MSHLYGLQVLRALAAFMVAVHHVQPDAALLAQRAGLTFEGSHLLPWLAGVDIFFVVSGFIMVHASDGLFDRPGATRLFLARRLARIAPLYWAATSLFLLVALAAPGALNSGAPNLTQIAGSYLFWPVVSPQGQLQPVYSLGWTLNYEMLFYALFGLALALPRALVAPAVTLALAALVGAQAALGPLPLPFGFWGQPIVLEFAAGMGLALLRGAGFRLGGGWRWLAAALGIGLLLVAARLEIDGQPWLTVLLRGGAASLLVLSATSGDGRSAPSALVRGLAHVGDASYALYLVHPFVIRGLRIAMSGAAPGRPILFVILALAAAILAALAVYRWFERPATDWLRRRLGA